MSATLEILAKTVVMLSLVGIAGYGQTRTLARPRPTAEVGAAVVASVRVLILLSALLPARASSAPIVVPFTISGAVMTLALSRALRREPA